MLQQFTNLNRQDKIDFFVKCQNLLLRFHPSSPFIINKGNIKERLTYAHDIFHKYKGMVYTDENVCALFNYIKINNINDPLEALKEHQFKSPAGDYNAVSIDFVVFRHLQDCLGFCKANYNSNIEYVVFVKDGKPKIHKTLDIMSKASKIPYLKSAIN
jgi:hypothetical protein